MELDIAIDGPWPAEPDWEELAQDAVHAAMQVAPELGHGRLTVSLLLTGDEAIHSLNLQWRGKDKPTNVLSFPMLERAALLDLSDEGPPEMLGDIALSHETCDREAAEKEISLEAHACHLIVHGLLHLAGYDHEISERDAQAMEALEIKALAIMGIDDPYCDRAF